MVNINIQITGITGHAVLVDSSPAVNEMNMKAIQYDLFSDN